MRAFARASLFVAAGVAALLAYPPYNLAPLAWISLIPLFNREPPRAWHRRLRDGYLYGLGFYGVGLSWLPRAIEDFAGFSAFASWAAFAAVGAFLALFPAIFKWGLGYVASRALRLFVFAPAAWLLLESLRLATWGGLPWLAIGSSQLHGPLRSWFPIVGEPGVTVLVVIFNGAILAVAEHWADGGRAARSGSTISALSIVLIACVAMSLASRIEWVTPRHPPRSIGIVATNVENLHALPASERNRLWGGYLALAAPMPSHPELVVLPEAALGSRVANLRDELTRVLPSEPDLLTGSIETTVGGDRYNSAFLLGADERKIYRKRRLVPFAEDRSGWLARSVLAGTHGTVLAGAAPGALPWRDTELGILICWEIRFSRPATRQVRNGAEILINQANHSWLESEAEAQRALNAARIRAIEVGRPLVRVTNGGISAHIDAAGGLRERFSATPGAGHVISLRAHQGTTPYVGLHLEVALRWIALALLVFVWFMERRRG